MDKIKARKTGLYNRAHLSAEERAKKNRLIQKAAIKEIKDKSVIGCYVSMKDEAETTEIIQYCFKHQKIIAVPKVAGRTLVFYRIYSFDDLEPGCFGVMEPRTNEIIPVSDIEVMFVPLSSYDDHYHRTGYGRGYYDSVLKDSMKNIGLAYTEQKMDSVETDVWDIELDDIISA